MVSATKPQPANELHQMLSQLSFALFVFFCLLQLAHMLQKVISLEASISRTT
jgi:hypothetical protein